MTESLAGRYFLHRCMHWTWPECEKAFGWSLEDWLVFGGYPGAAPLAHDESLWRRYVTDSLVEAVLARDVMTGHRIAKPVLLRHLFALACAYPRKRDVSAKRLSNSHRHESSISRLLHVRPLTPDL